MERKERKEKNKVTALDYFICGMICLIEEISYIIKAVYSTVRSVILILRGLYIYNKEFYYKIPALWALCAFHGVVVLLAFIKPFEGATIEAMSNHIMGNCLCFFICAIWSAYMLWEHHEESEAKERIRTRKLAWFLRRHGIEVRRKF